MSCINCVGRASSAAYQSVQSSSNRPQTQAAASKPSQPAPTSTRDSDGDSDGGGIDVSG